MLVFIIGLVVLGPSRLPVVVKTVSGWLRTLHSLTSRVLDELNRELKQLELQKCLRKMEKALLDTLPSGVRESMDELREVAASMTPAPSPRPEESGIPDTERDDASVSGGGETEDGTGTTPLPLIGHLTELRRRLIRCILAVLAIILALVCFSSNIYQLVSAPLIRQLPAGVTMIATDVVSPFFTPIKLTLMVSIALSVPAILHQVWGFVTPALYRTERRTGRYT